MEFSRRQFMAGAGALAAAPAVLGDAKKVFKVGLVGCGGRGCQWRGGVCGQMVDGAWRGGGAIHDISQAARRLGCRVQLVAAADFDRQRAVDVCRRYGVDEKMAFGGANGYKDVVAADCDIVLLCTPPLFRARQAAACVAAGRHIFAEKPVATDPRGLRAFLKTVADAKAKNLSILSGTLHRHSNRFLR